MITCHCCPDGQRGVCHKFAEMSVRYSIGFLLNCLLIVFVRAEFAISLTSQNFDEEIATADDWLLEFYAPWCGHCQRLAPIYEEVAEKMTGGVKVAKVNCDVHKGLCSRFSVKGFPTLMMLHKNTLHPYKGARSFQALTDFAKGGFASTVGSFQLPAVGESLSEQGFIDKIWDFAYEHYILASIYSTLVCFMVALFVFVVYDSCCHTVPQQASPVPLQSAAASALGVGGTGSTASGTEPPSATNVISQQTAENVIKGGKAD